MRALLLLLAAAALVSGCDALFPTLCPQDERPGIVVRIFDAATGEPAADDAVGIAQDGAYTDTLTAGEFDAEGRTRTIRGADERPGRYDVVVRKAGYETWRRGGVLVREGECHVRMAELEARLEQDAPADNS